MKKLKLLLICSILCFSITGCGKSEEDETTSEKHAYATNETFDKHSTTESTESQQGYIIDGTTESNDSTEAITEKKEDLIDYKYYKEQKLQFNVDEDVNAKSEAINNTKNGTLSIDGKLLTLPCTYQTLKDTFGKVYIEIPDSDGLAEITDPKLYNNISDATLAIYPTTGDGEVKFTLTSNKNTSLDQMICNKVELKGYTYTDKKLFTCSIQDDIHFGSSLSQVKNSLGTRFDADLEHQNSDTGYYDYTYSGKNDNGDKYQINLTFRNSRVFYISVYIKSKN